MALLGEETLALHSPIFPRRGQELAVYTAMIAAPRGKLR